MLLGVSCLMLGMLFLPHTYFIHTTPEMVFDVLMCCKDTAHFHSLATQADCLSKNCV